MTKFPPNNFTYATYKHLCFVSLNQSKFVISSQYLQQHASECFCSLHANRRSSWRCPYGIGRGRVERPPHRICQANFWFQLIYCNKLRGGSAFIPRKVRGHSFPRGWFVWFIWRNGRIASLSEWYQTRFRIFGSVSPIFFLKTHVRGPSLAVGWGWEEERSGGIDGKPTHF